MGFIIAKHSGLFIQLAIEESPASFSLPRHTAHNTLPPTKATTAQNQCF